MSSLLPPLPAPPWLPLEIIDLLSDLSSGRAAAVACKGGKEDGGANNLVDDIALLPKWPPRPATGDG